MEATSKFPYLISSHKFTADPPCCELPPEHPIHKTQTDAVDDPPPDPTTGLPPGDGI